MAEYDSQPVPTPSVLLELREERQVVREGFQFLDEKRLLLAAEILRQLDDYQRMHRQFMELHQQAADALRQAVARHGLEGLQVHPAPVDLDDAHLVDLPRRFLGVTLTAGELELPRQSPPPDAVDPSPEARRCAALFRELVERSARLAAITGNLERLLDEYRRTERRARALEDVLLPEVERALAEVESRLEELDLEEALRSRIPHRGLTGQ